MASCVLALSVAAPTHGQDGLGARLANVVFDQASPLSRNDEMAHRLLSPLVAEELDRQLTSTGEAMRDQPLDLKQERFVLFVPRHAPPQGYGLLVFVPPWPDARIPEGWEGPLDRAGIIFVSAANSGNDANVLGRRAPLALVAAQNVMARYPVDHGRVYVGGFSGGSRVAQRLALAYPDLFRGAFLNAGADAIGVSIGRLPARDLLAQVQENTRLVFATGAQDGASQIMDAGAISTLRQDCVTAIRAINTPGVGHEAASGSVLARGLAFIDAPPAVDPGKLAACRAGLQHDLDSAVAKVQADIDRGDKEAARKAIIALDARFAGFAGRQAIDLSDACHCALMGPLSRP